MGRRAKNTIFQLSKLNLMDCVDFVPLYDKTDLQ